MTDVTSADQRPSGTPSTADEFDLLANRRTRKVLTTLRERTGAISKQDLATILASKESDTPLHEVTDEQRRTLLTSLHHKHLPKLEAASLIETTENGAVRVTDTPALAADSLIPTALDLPADEHAKDVAFEMLASDVRRILVQTLRNEEETTVETLVETVTDHTGMSEGDAVVTLSHTHLPKLDEYDVVAFDRDEGRVTYEGLPMDVDPLLDQSLTDDSSVLTGDDIAENSDIWTIRGRENVVERGQGLFDRAEDELFLMVTTDGLLEPACIEKLQDALDRGVDVYLGSQTTEVRDLVREEAPEVTIWEPQLNWLNLPPSQETLGRLVMADREAVMLGTLGEQHENGIHTERALTGEGPANPLVILLREALGSRLDHLDGQSADVLSQIPL